MSPSPIRTSPPRGEVGPPALGVSAELGHGRGAGRKGQGRRGCPFPLGDPVPLNFPGSLRGSFFFVFLGLQLKHMEVSRLGVESELQLLVYTTATATPEVSCICDLRTLPLMATLDP